VIDSADAMLRAAVESCRQHERVGRLIEKQCSDEELASVAELCDICSRHLGDRTTAYETAAAAGKGKNDDAIWHAANTLWHSSREYSRRHQSCDSISTKLKSKSEEAFGALTMEYELEASAVLALRQTIAAYRKLRPDAE
jgi:phosphoribosyl-ATP pyrophosphohydrolase